MSSLAHEIRLRIRPLLQDAELAQGAAFRLLKDANPSDATEALQALIVARRSGDAEAEALLPVLSAALERYSADIPHAHALRRVAALQDHGHVERLFVEGPPKLHYDADAAKRADARLFSQPLGHLKMRARLTRNPDELARLAVASDASVVRNVLLNPRITEDWVVRIAARRPARPEPLVEIWHSPKWSRNALVRKALAFNPYLPPAIGAKIVPLLLETDLKELSRDGGVHESIRAQAAALLEAAKKSRQPGVDPDEPPVPPRSLPMT